MSKCGKPRLYYSKGMQAFILLVKTNRKRKQIEVCAFGRALHLFLATCTTCFLPRGWETTPQRTMRESHASYRLVAFFLIDSNIIHFYIEG
jgi:hypothetical protein